MSAEVPTVDESRSLARAEKAGWVLRMRKSGELLERGKTTGACKYGFCDFLLRKNGCSGPLWGCCGFLLFRDNAKRILLIDAAR